MERFGHSKMLCQQSRFVGQSGERELCLGKTERVFRTQKLEKTGKIFNIKSRLFRNGRNILGNSRAFCIRKMHLKTSAKINISKKILKKIFQNINTERDIAKEE